MRIMILTWLFPPSSGGVESYTYELARSLSKNNKIIIFTTGRSYKGEDKERFKIYRIGEMYPYKRKNKDYIKLSKYLKNILEKENVDVVHSHNLICLPTKYSSTIIKTIKNLGIPLIDQCHDARYKYLNKRLVKKDFQKIIAVSNFVKKRLLSIGVNRKKIVIVNNAVDVTLFNPFMYKKEKARKYFNLPLYKNIIIFPSRAIKTTTGNFGRQKGFLRLLKATPKIKKIFGRNFVIVFPSKVGLKDSKKARRKTLLLLNKRLKKENIRENVIWINRKISLQEMPLFYKAADIMCTPSINEAFGLVFIEAMLMQLPCIGTESGALPEIIKQSKTGYMIKPFNTKELVDIIVKLLGNKRLREKIGKRAREYALKKFSYRNMVRKIVKIYLNVLETEKNKKQKNL